MTKEKTYTNKIKIAHISTKTAAQNFFNSLEFGKTYFLNGDWGSGKTEFIHEVQQNSGFKFKYLDLWHIVDERSVVTRGFCLLHPIAYYLLRIAFVMCVGFSFLMTNVSRIGLQWMTNNYIGKILGIVGLLVAIWSFFRIKSDYVYVYILKKLPRNTKKIIIIDDFDRVSPKEQEQAYLFFNIIQNKYTVIFLGDFKKIALSRGSYLRKIIDMKFSLPYVLQPISIWATYLSTVASHLKLTLSQVSSLETIATEEQRNLRDQKQFNDLLNQEFYQRKKLDHVRAYDQLLIIYIYLFHEDLYESFLRGKDPDFSNSLKISNGSDMPNTTSSPIPSGVKDDVQEGLNNDGKALYSELQRLTSHSSECYPLPFGINPEPYFISEPVSNRTSAELDTILNSPETLKKELNINSRTDFYQYLSINFENFKSANLNTLLDTAISVYHENISTPSVNLILYLNDQKIRRMIPENFENEIIEQTRKIAIAKYKYSQWEKKLTPLGYDQSEVAAFVADNSFLSYNLLARIMSIENLEEISRNALKRPDTMLLLYLSGNDLWEKYDEWSDGLWRSINLLPSKLFINFLLKQRLIEDPKGTHDFHSTQKSYILVTSFVDFDVPHKKHSTMNAINRIDGYINNLKQEGYVFTKNPSISRNYKI